MPAGNRVTHLAARGRRERRAVVRETPEPIAELAEAARGGDPGAWEELYLLVYPRLVAFAQRRLDPEQAKDAVAETMARAVAGIGRVTWGSGGVEGWLFGILRHVVTDEHRRRARSTGGGASLEAEGRDLAEPSDALLADEEAVLVRAAFARLDQSDQELLHLRVVAGLSSEAVATIVGKRPGSVRMAQARALARLRAALHEVSA